MKEELFKKYVKDLDGLVKEVKSWGEEFTVLHQTFQFAERWMYETGVIFLFGRLYKFLDFRDITIGGKGLDAAVRWQDEVKNLEFEVLSSGFKEHIKRGDVKPEDYKNTIIVCWEDDWKEAPKEIDIIVLKDLLGLGLKDILAA
jgi:hypothetical protein